MGDVASAIHSRASVLLVDDVKANLIALSALLKPLGARLVEAQSARDALAAIQQEQFAVALLDVQMPEMDGFQLATALRELEYGRRLPVLFVTAIHQDDSYVKRGYAAGAVDYITKPFDAEIVRARVRGFVDLFEGRERYRNKELFLRTSERDEAQRKLRAFERIAAADWEEPLLEGFFRELLAFFLDAADTADSAAILLREQGDYVVRAAAGTDRSVFQKIPDLIDDMESKQNPHFGAFELANADASSPATILSCMPLIHTGETYGFACIASSRAPSFSPGDLMLFRAVAERAAWSLSQQLERRLLYDVFGAIPALISILRMPSMKCIFASPDLRGLMAKRDPVGISASDMGMGAGALAIIEEAYQTGRPVSADELPFMSNGSARFVQFTAQPLRNLTGTIDRVITFATEVTSLVKARKLIEEHESERSLLLEKEQAARAEAERANREKDEFLAMISHELRTPLQAIFGWTAIAQRKAPPELKQALDTIERNAKRQTSLIEDLLDVSRITNGTLRLDRRTIDLAEVINAAVDAIQPAAKAKSLALESAVAPFMDFMGDAERLQQVFGNILSNAVKFTPGGGQINVQASSTKGGLRISISDTGEGIEPEALPLIFDAFRQGSSSSTRRHSGMGLGLTLAKQLIEAHGGSINAASGGPGHGTTITVDLPFAKSATASESRVAESENEAPAKNVRLNHLKILVVEDDDDARELLSEILQHHFGASVTTSASAAEGMEALQRFRPDVVISDLSMPDVDGYDFIRSVRQLDAAAGGGTPAIALSAQGRAEDGGRALTAGFQLYVSKPVDIARLVAAITSLKPAPATDTSR